MCINNVKPMTSFIKVFRRWDDGALTPAFISHRVPRREFDVPTNSYRYSVVNKEHTLIRPYKEGVVYTSEQGPGYCCLMSIKDARDFMLMHRQSCPGSTFEVWRVNAHGLRGYGMDGCTGATTVLASTIQLVEKINE